MIGPRRRQFDGDKGIGQFTVNRPPRQGKVLDRPQGMDAPQHVGRDSAEFLTDLFLDVVETGRTFQPRC